jgi:hypothetical protein
MPFYETDLDFNKKFSALNDKIKIEFRSELYNIFNHTNLYLPGGSGGGTAGSGGGSTSITNVSTSITSPPAGTIITGTFSPRIIQFGLKITY